MTPRIIAYAVAALALLALVLWGPAACSRLIAEREARKIESGQAEATLESLDLGNATEAERQKVADAIEADAKALADTVRAAEPGDSNDEAMAAACQTQTYRDTPACVELREKADAP